MKRLMTVLAVVAAFCSTTAFAADSCENQADAKKLAGAARTSFVKKCEKDNPPKDAASCEARATDKKLAGAAKSSFVTKCEKDAKSTSAKATCDTQAADKKLAGAAKNSFVKKCVADAGA
ncbi:MAG: hypothetical protein ABW067_14410 [Rhizobacter sp.]|jgi:hypothetical protein